MPTRWTLHVILGPKGRKGVNHLGVGMPVKSV
jgi:hypothetical protein